jgi:hypothetical protein
MLSDPSLLSTASPNSPLMRRKGRSLRPPISLEHFLSSSDYGRDGRFRAQSRLRSDEKDADISEQISGESMEEAREFCQIRDQS